MIANSPDKVAIGEKGGKKFFLLRRGGGEEGKKKPFLGLLSPTREMLRTAPPRQLESESNKKAIPSKPV